MIFLTSRAGIQDSEMARGSDDPIPLPDIKEAKRKKEAIEELARVEEEKEMNRPKIKRSDTKAFTKVRSSVDPLWRDSHQRRLLTIFTL